MADNTILPIGGAGDTIRTEDRAGTKTPVSLIDVGGTTGAEAIIGDVGVTLPVSGTVTVTGVATAANQTTMIGHLDGVEGLLTTMDADTGGIATSAASIDGKITACNTGAVVVSSSALPSGAATAAKQPTLGIAGTASADVITVQGIASMTALKVDGSAVTQPVSGTVSVTGVATAANQATEITHLSTLAGIDFATGADLASLAVVGGGTEATALRVTIANDSTGLVSIDDGGGSITVDGTVAVSGSVDTELTTADLDTGVGTDTRAVVGLVLAASGGGLLVGSANPMPVSGTFWQATQPVSNAGTFAVQAAQSGTWTVQPGNTANTTAWLVTGTGGTFPVTDSGGSLTVDGTVTVTATALDVRALVKTTDSVIAWGNTAKDGSGTNYIPLLDADGHIQADVLSGGGGTQYTEGDIDASVTGTAIMWEDAADTLRVVSAAKPLPISDAGGSLTVDGTFWQATQPVSLASVPSHDVTNAGTFAVQAAQSGTWNINNVSGIVSLPTGASTAANQTTIIGHVDGIESLLTTIDADTGNIATSVMLMDDAVATLGTTTYTEASTKGFIIAAVRRDADTTLVGTTNELGPLQMDANGRLKVEVFSGETLTVTGTGGTFPVTDSGGTLTVDDGGTTLSIDDGAGSITVDNAALSVVGGGTEATALRVTIANDSTGVLSVDDNGGSLTVDNTVLSVVGNGAAATAQRVTLANDSTGVIGTVTTVSTLTGSGVAHDAADSGNPHKIGVKATTSPAGLTLVASADRTDAMGSVDGFQYVRQIALEDVVQETKSNTDGASTAMTAGLAAPGAGIRLWICSVTIANSSATNITVDLRDGSAGSVLWTFPVPANGGVTHRFDPPLKLTANTALAFDGSAAATTLYVSANGFKSKV